MKDKKFKKALQQTFDKQVPDVLEQIKNSSEFRIPPKPKTNHILSIFNIKYSYVLTSVLVIALIIVASVSFTKSPVVAATVTLDVNPSIIITLDDNDKVISVEAVNNDGETVIDKNIHYRGLTIEEVVDALITRLQNLGYIVTLSDEANIVLIEVQADDTTIQSRIEERFRSRLDQQLNNFNAPHWVMNARDIQLNNPDQTNFDNKLIINTYTRAKLTLVYRIHELDSSYSITDLQNLSVRELYFLFMRLENPDNLPNYDNMPGHRSFDIPFTYNAIFALT
jgi:hypothetical protein